MATGGGDGTAREMSFTRMGKVTREYGEKERNPVFINDVWGSTHAPSPSRFLIVMKEGLGKGLRPPSQVFLALTRKIGS